MTWITLRNHVKKLHPTYKVVVTKNYKAPHYIVEIVDEDGKKLLVKSW